MFVDADAHVDECNATWSYFPKSMVDLRPVEMDFTAEEPGYIVKGNKPSRKIPRRGVLIDGYLAARPTFQDNLTHTTVATRELTDVPARLRHLDELGIGSQVLFPTMLLDEVTPRPELEIAICESYNRWIADRCADSKGRLRWVALLPSRSMPDALREMSRAKEAGAVGVFKRAVESGNRRAGDQYFHPIYELAQDLDLPICIHISGPYTGTTPSLTGTRKGVLRTFYVQDAFLSLLLAGVDRQFPKLRIGFIEAGSGWVHYLLWLAKYEHWIGAEVLDPSTADQNFERHGFKPEDRSRFKTGLAESRLFVTCELMEDLDDLVAHIGDTNLMIGSDYGHVDRTAALMAHQLITRDSQLDAAVAERLTVTNAREFYGL